MSLYHLENQATYRYGIWKIEEDEETLAGLSGCVPPIRLSNLVRRAEYLSVRALAKAMGVDPKDICYHQSGKPFLKNGKETISISHTKKVVAVMFSQKPLAGIDVETRSRRVVRIRHKFMHPDEERLLRASGMDEIIGLLLHWCVKEAIFKAIPDASVDFSNEIRVTDFRCSGATGRLAAIALRENRFFQVDYRIEADFVLTCCFSS